MPLFERTELMDRALDHALRRADVEPNVRRELEAAKGGGPGEPVDAAILQQVARVLRRDEHDQRFEAVWFHQLIRGSSPVVHDPPKRKSSPAVRAMFADIRREWEAKQYAKMVDSVKSSRSAIGHEKREMRTYWSQMSMALNLIVTRVSVFVAGWWIGRQYGSEAFGFVLGIVFMIIALAVEVTLFMIKGWRLERSISDRKKKEDRVLPGSEGLRGTPLHEIEWPEELKPTSARKRRANEEREE